MSLETAIQALADELKRYNDSRDFAAAGEPTPVIETPKPAKAAKTTKAAPKVEEPKVVTLNDALARATKFVADHGRDALIEIMQGKFKKPKVRDFENDPDALAKIIVELDAYEPDPTV